MISRDAMARMVDHTLLKPEATAAQVRELADEARRLGVFSVCISPSMLDCVVNRSGIAVATVVGFPSGKHTSGVKAAEAAGAVAGGANEVDMVIDIGALKAGDVDAVQADITAVRESMPTSALLKVIIESAALTDDEIVAACQAAERAGAQFVKTSTGFHPSGGATVHAVSLMAKTVGGRLGVKASGGIRSWDDAVALIDAGATRLGLSGTQAVLDGGAPSGDGY